MSKFNLYGLKYKEVLIIKHALRDKIAQEDEFLNGPICLKKIKDEKVEKYKKDHEEHKRCYKKVEEQVQLIQDYINGKGKLY